jgi:hypothetical protein
MMHIAKVLNVLPGCACWQVLHMAFIDESCGCKYYQHRKNITVSTSTTIAQHYLPG